MKSIAAILTLSVFAILSGPTHAQSDCERKAADLDQSGFVDAGDISVMLLLFGAVDPCCGLNCDDGDPDTVDTCMNGVCQHINPCDDGLACTIDAIERTTGECTHTIRNCDDGSPCTIDACNELTGACEHVLASNGTPCSDGSLCTERDACVDGKCIGQPKNCDDLDPCTLDFCDPLEGCRWQQDPRPECMTGPGLRTNRMTLVARCTREVCTIMPSCCDAEWDVACTAIASTMTSCDAAGVTSPVEDTIQSESPLPSLWHGADREHHSR